MTKKKAAMHFTLLEIVSHRITRKTGLAHGFSSCLNTGKCVKILVHGNLRNATNGMDREQIKNKTLGCLFLTHCIYKSNIQLTISARIIGIFLRVRVIMENKIVCVCLHVSECVCGVVCVCVGVCVGGVVRGRSVMLVPGCLCSLFCSG